MTGPRFIIKFISSSYFPLDRDLVREMWVLGDLKDQLGIKHRRERRKGDTEQTPMFEPEYHEQSVSEVGSVDLSYNGSRDSRGIYVPAGTQSPPGPPAATPQSKATFPTIPPDSHFGHVVDDNEVWDTVTTPTQHPTPELPMSRASYYSLSNIPSPSPLPEANVYSPTSSRPVTMTSVAMSPVTGEHRPSQLPQLQSNNSLSPHGSPPHTPRSDLNPPRSPRNNLSVATNPGEYEMGVRSSSQSSDPDRAPSHATQRSESSFFTAREGSSSGYDTVQEQSHEDDTAKITARPQVEPGDNDAWRESVSSQVSGFTASPHAL